MRKNGGGYGPASYWTSDEVHVCGLDVINEHREVIERRAQQVEQAVHEDVDAHLVRVRVRIRAIARSASGTGWPLSRSMLARLPAWRASLRVKKVSAKPCLPARPG